MEMKPAVNCKIQGAEAVRAVVCAVQGLQGEPAFVGYVGTETGLTPKSAAFGPGAEGYRGARQSDNDGVSSPWMPRAPS